MTDNRKILIAIVVFVVLVAAFALWNINGLKDEFNGIAIEADGERLVTFTMEELRALPPVEVEKTITSGEKKEEHGLYKGVPIEKLLDRADESWREKYKSFTLWGGDGYASAISKSDIIEGENVLIVYEKDGKPLEHFSEGGAGPIRAIIVMDPFGNRSAQYLVKIELGK